MKNYLSNYADLFVMKFTNSTTLYYFNSTSNELSQIIKDVQPQGIEYIKREVQPLKFKKMSKQEIKLLFSFNTENEQALQKFNFIK